MAQPPSFADPMTPAAVRLVPPTRVADEYRAMDMLRLSTAGNVDDGKSTLIGRLMLDSRAVLSDQLAAVKRASRRRGSALDLALLTDGLRAEREQNITIDVAYRYFTTARRKFIIADTPGHVQYTRNMVTGASTADLAIVLVDATKGVRTQSRRHAFISALLGIRHLTVAVNKMDLAGYDAAHFDRIVGEFTEFAAKFDVRDLLFIPISALHGDNVVQRSVRMPWYEGSTLLHHLETVNIAAGRNLQDFRFPVQYVIHPPGGRRGLAGAVVSGTIRPGEPVAVLPSGRTTVVESVAIAGAAVDEAVAGDAVVITLADEVDAGRGDMIVRIGNLPVVADRFHAQLCWMAETRPEPGKPYVLMHATRAVSAVIARTLYRLDVDSLHREPDASLGLNDVGRVELATAQPLCFDPYALNKATGGFVLVDPYTNATVAAGVIRGEARTLDAVRAVPDDATLADPRPGDDVSPVDARLAATAPGLAGVAGVARQARERRNGHRAAVVWFTGLSGSGKSTIARAVERELFELGCQTALLDGDELREGLNRDLRFSAGERRENIRRAGEVANLFYRHGAIALCAFISPFAADRNAVRASLPADAFLEIFVDCPLEECVRRDPKGLYTRAADGAIPDFTGLASPYEAPASPDLNIDTSSTSVARAVRQVLALLSERRILEPPEDAG
jgi:bifunctional enzyme CysN/CysC